MIFYFFFIFQRIPNIFYTVDQGLANQFDSNPITKPNKTKCDSATTVVMLQTTNQMELWHYVSKSS